MRFHKLVHESENCNTWLIEWPVGTGLDWHHHGDSDAHITVLEGQLTEWVASKDVKEPSDLIASSDHWEGSQWHMYHWYQHKIVNNGDVTAVSLHTYRPPLKVLYDEALEIG